MIEIQLIKGQAKVGDNNWFTFSELIQYDACLLSSMSMNMCDPMQHHIRFGGGVQLFLKTNYI